MNFKSLLNRIKLSEDTTVGGGAFGAAAAEGHGGAVGNSDFYAPGDARIPKVIGVKKRKKRLKRFKRKGTK